MDVGSCYLSRHCLPTLFVPNCEAIMDQCLAPCSSTRTRSRVSSSKVHAPRCLFLLVPKVEPSFRLLLLLFVLALLVSESFSSMLLTSMGCISVLLMGVVGIIIIRVSKLARPKNLSNWKGKSV